MNSNRKPKEYPAWQWKMAKIVWAIVLPIGAILLYLGSKNEPAPAGPKRGSLAYETCEGDIDCAQSRSMSDASVECAPQIERLARYQVRWTNEGLQPIFQRWRWSERYDIVQKYGQNRIIEYAGDTLQFQNGFGAFRRMAYECDYDPLADVVIAYRVNEF